MTSFQEEQVRKHKWIFLLMGSYIKISIPILDGILDYLSEQIVMKEMNACQ